MLTISDILKNLANDELKEALAKTSLSPEDILYHIASAYLLAQREYNLNQEKEASPIYLSTITATDRQSPVIDSQVIYEDVTLTLRFRKVLEAVKIIGISGPGKPIL
jgi:hypothetical protein